ncbi:MAG: hypothetical protein ACREDO_05810 [Methyloceanibacter sp.]
MLTALTTGLRFRCAILLAGFASLCFVAPPAVLAMGHGKDTVHCLANADTVNHGMNNAGGGSHHGHQPAVPEGKSASHTDHSAPDAHQMNCCGLFCLSAVEVEAREIIDLGCGQAYFPSRADNLLGRSPERLDRPPISLLSI